MNKFFFFHHHFLLLPLFLLLLLLLLLLLRCYSPTRALTSYIFLFQDDLSSEALLQAAMPNICLASAPTASIHLSFGLPIGLLPYILPSIILLGVLWFSILFTCPAHSSLWSLIYVAILLHQFLIISYSPLSIFLDWTNYTPHDLSFKHSQC